jgi:DNA-binding NarL/FixJ family response regulator
VGKIRVLLADDNQAVREELPKLLEEHGDIEIIGAAENGRTAVEMANASSPDVIVMDVKMPELDGITATRMIHANHPDIRVIMLSIYEKTDYLSECLEAGASTYMVKSTEIDSLANEIRRIFHEEETETTDPIKLAENGKAGDLT